jgi:holo-[acyl-carrier protein] synthase
VGMLSVGVDLIETGRIARALERRGDRFLSHVYTPAEVRFCRNHVGELAARFAAKEAVSKALGTGLRGVTWREMEVLSDARGKPLIRLHGRAKKRAEELGLEDFAVSLSHSRKYAVAFVVASD